MQSKNIDPKELPQIIKQKHTSSVSTTVRSQLPFEARLLSVHNTQTHGLYLKFGSI